MTSTTLEDAQYCLAHPDVLHTPAQHREIIAGLLALVPSQGTTSYRSETTTVGNIKHEVVTVTQDLSPEGINRSHGKPVWRCFGCKAETGLHWYHGWSVAMCRKPECAKAYDDLVAGQIAEQESLEAHYQEIHG